jgi:hypothetical protein
MSICKEKQLIEGSDGYSTFFGLTNTELTSVRELIKLQWLSRIEEFNQSLVEKFKSIEMDRYHELSHLLPHEKIWSKSKRILSSDACEKIRQTSLIKSLEAEFGPFLISGEDGIEKEEIYWRIVRPNCASDIGPLHADSWFWSLGNWKTPARHKRIKVWISIYSEAGKNGFKLIRGSHRKQWKYHGEERDGYVKPVFDDDITDLSAEIFPGSPGKAIVFNDNLLHGGVVGETTTRVSLEFTMFVRI